MTTVQLTTDQLAELADLVVDRLAERIAVDSQPASGSTNGGTARLVTAGELAALLSVSRECIYQHAVELGGKRVGDGPRGRLRFDQTVALARWRNEPTDTPSRTTPTKTRRRSASTSDVQLLPIRGESR